MRNPLTPKHGCRCCSSSGLPFEVDSYILGDQQVNARAVEVIGERCNIYGVKELQFSIPEGPTYQYTPQTKEDFGHQKLTGNLYQNMYY